MKNYLELMANIRKNGVDRSSRSGTTRALFAQQLRWNLQDGFPAVTTKRLAFKSVVAELLWFLSGSTDLKDLRAMGCRIWDADAERWFNQGHSNSKDDVGRIYPAQWRHWLTIFGDEVDQIAKLVDGIRKDPFSRYHVVTAWNPGELDQMCLPACHMGFQVFCYPDKRMSLAMTQRSCDTALGVPFNIASYALLLHMLASITGHTPHELVVEFRDVHIYHNHFEAVDEQLKRDPYPLPKLEMFAVPNGAPDNGKIKLVERLPVVNLEDFVPGDFSLKDYQFHPPIKAQLNVG